MLVGFSFSFAVVAFVVSVVGLALAIYAVINVEAFKRSTHRIEYVPGDKMLEELGMGDDKINEEYRKSMSKLTEELSQNIPMQEEVI